MLYRRIPNLRSRILASVWLAAWSLSAQAAFIVPRAGTPEELAALTQRLTTEAPWMAANAANIPTIVNGTGILLPLLEADPTWQKLAAERPDPVLILVDVTKLEQRAVRAVKHDVAIGWRREMSEVIISAQKEHEGSGVLGALVQKTASELAWVSAHDARGLITGMINALPGHERGAYFKMPSPEEQLKGLRGNPAFSDEAVKATFRAESFGIDRAQVSRDFLLNLAQESLQREAHLTSLLRATWYAQSLEDGNNSAKLAELGQDPAAALGNAPDSAFDLFNAAGDPAKIFLEKLAQEASRASDNPGQALTKRVTPYIQRLTKGQVNEANYEERVEEVPVVAKTFRVQEVPAEIGATRGYLMQDCSKGAWGFAYSPNEIIYLVSDANGAPTGFIAAASVMSGEQKTLFVHDFGGANVTAEMVNYVLEGMYQALPRLGFAQMTINTANGNVGQYSATMNPRMNSLTPVQIQQYQAQIDAWEKQIEANPALRPNLQRNIDNYKALVKPNGKGFKVRAQQQYLDAAIRQTIYASTKYPHQYDSATNANNLNPYIYESNPDVAPTTQTRIERSSGGSLVEIPKSRPEAIMRAIEMYNANPEAGVTAEMMRIDGLRASDLQALFQALKNPQQLQLEQYYGGLQDAFGKLEINLSRNFIRENGYLFWEGQLRAPDATTSSDATLVNRTVEYVILSMKRLPQPTAALAILQRDRAFFLGNEKFQGYLNSFTGHGINEAPQIEKLMAIGYDFNYLKADHEALLRLIDGQSPRVREWAIQALPTEALKQLKPEVVRKIAADLAADDDDLPRNASRILMFTNNKDAEVIKELKLSVNEEEDEVVATRAAVALIECGDFGPGSVRRLIRNIRNREIEPETLTQVRRLLRELKTAKDARYCDALLINDKEEPDDA